MMTTDSIRAVRIRRIQRRRKRRIVAAAISATAIAIAVVFAKAVQVPAPAAVIDEEQARGATQMTTTVTVEEPVESGDYFYITNIPLPENTQERIGEIAEKYNISYTFLLSVIWKESRFEPTAMGDAEEACGLMQVQPKWYQEEIKALGITEPLDPAQNVELGAYILRELFEKYEDAGLVLMAYNAGEAGAKRQWTAGIYETNYTKAIFEKQNEYEALREGKTRNEDGIERRPGPHKGAR